MPSPVDPTRPQMPAEEAFLELLVETLEGLDRPVRGQFLQRYFRTVAQAEFSEAQSLEYWERILARRQELSDSLGEPISLKTAMVDVFASGQHFRVPILVEYEELKRLQFNAATDPLTGLYNRRFFEDSFEKEMNRARRYDQHLAVVLLDLHEFKIVNDRYGHPQGDAALRIAANTLRKSLRSSDYAFRIGGDEFALVLPQADPEQAEKLSRRVCANFEVAVQSLGLDVPLGLDYGLAVYPLDGDQREALVQAADQRLYQMKHSGRAEPAGAPPPALRTAPSPPAEKPAMPKPAPPPPMPAAPPTPGWAGQERRKWERVSLSETRAYAQVGETPGTTVRVLDLGYGGVALQTDAPDAFAGSFYAILHVPILPPVRVSLRRIYQLPRRGEPTRVGCSFVS